MKKITYTKWLLDVSESQNSSVSHQRKWNIRISYNLSFVLYYLSFFVSYVKSFFFSSFEIEATRRTTSDHISSSSRILDSRHYSQDRRNIMSIKMWIFHWHKDTYQKEWIISTLTTLELCFMKLSLASMDVGSGILVP